MKAPSPVLQRTLSYILEYSEVPKGGFYSMSSNASESSGTDRHMEIHTSQIQRRTRSQVWEHFEVNLMQSDGELKAICKYCGLGLNTKSGTSSLRGHLECQTIRNDCLKKYEEMKRDLQVELLSLASRVCLTSDIWTSSQNLGYMVVTAHFIGAEFKIKKKIIWFKELEYPHTGYAIEEEIVRCVIDWEIKDKMFTLTMDNASNNTSACELLTTDHKHDLLFEGKHLHIRCCAHILNILVQDGMRIIHTAIDKIRELLKHIDSSPSRLQAFNSIANGKGLPSKHDGTPLTKCSEKHWSTKLSLTLMLLNTMKLLRVKMSGKKQKLFVNFQAFEELTLAVSAHREPTAHKFLPLVLCIQHALKDPAWQTTNLLKELAASMCSKFEKYWEPSEDNHQTGANSRRKNKEIAFNIALVIATILDPRRKAYFLRFFFNKVCKDNDQIGMHVDLALEWMRKYFAQYEKQHPRTGSMNTMTRANELSVTKGSPLVGKRKLEDEFNDYMSQMIGMRASKSEIDEYLEEKAEVDREGFDVLAWWKSNAQKYPILSTMARDFLAIPLSTVSSEAAFSCSGRILGDHRSSLAPEMLEALVCAKDWSRRGMSIPRRNLTMESDEKVEEEKLEYAELAGEWRSNRTQRRRRVELWCRAQHREPAGVKALRHAA
ncbi:hypothetical protein U9M48_012585 [Paspalum notatum var. saurae]|uniref:BED-type domain-containing protein n=1 Tax=Paspalum notatum var. saurae TaxID=547442 RepID=A0AAQ3WIR4_PASNO